MLSFDVTDRNIRVVQGEDKNGKIRINKAGGIELEEGIINNGSVKDVPRLATLVNRLLKQSRMKDKEATIAISSNLIIFKELEIKKDKKQNFTKLVQDAMRAAMNLDSSYSISYVIVGEDSEDKNTTIVLATACPFEIIECYKKLCSMLELQLKVAMVSCNASTKVILSDKKNEHRMPLLSVQVDKTFISCSIFDENQLVFTRFADIAKEDYGNSDDYVFEAVQDNVERMLQFYRFKDPDRPIENILLYGDTKDDYVRYVKFFDEEYQITTANITAPPNIHGYENLEFALYVNAIGALFARNPEREWVNLLEVDTVNNNKYKTPKFFAISYFLTIFIIIAGLGTWVVLLLLERNRIQDDIEYNTKYVEDTEMQYKLTEFEKTNQLIVQVESYSNVLKGALNAYDTHVRLSSDIYKRINEVIAETVGDSDLVVSSDESKDYLDRANITFPDSDVKFIPAGSKCEVTYPVVSIDGTISFSVVANEPIDPEEPGQGDLAIFPKTLVRKFIDYVDEEGNPYFTDPEYTNYSITIEEQENSTEERRIVTFNINMSLVENTPPDLEQYKPAETEAEGGNE
ncbi:MAG: pilus assembly protein PilM [Oscillospiraceae bacterium]|jgi:type IV pilus assembly protein PilM|nr:pilus assembly protein PilM [Oscillospiraceae bacterium]